jgi:hypothetical protein
MFFCFRLQKWPVYSSIGFVLLCHFVYAQKLPVQYVETRIGTAPAATESAKMHSEAGSELKGQTEHLTE